MSILREPKLWCISAANSPVMSWSLDESLLEGDDGSLARSLPMFFFFPTFPGLIFGLACLLFFPSSPPLQLDIGFCYCLFSCSDTPKTCPPYSPNRQKENLSETRSILLSHPIYTWVLRDKSTKAFQSRPIPNTLSFATTAPPLRARREPWR